VHEELDELKHELQASHDKARIEDELGDLIFALVNLARKNNLNPDDALEHTNAKFIRRFMFIEAAAKKEGKALSSMTLEEMDALWNAAKKQGL
jgi:XTP/dITP diphosphohydrolase